MTPTPTSAAPLTPGNTCTHDTHDTCTHPPGATLWLGGQAWAHPALAPTLTPITTLTTYPGNPRRGDQNAITASIQDLGIYKAQITTQTTTGHVLTGNHTLRGLLALDALLAPATAINVDDTRAAAIVARDNRTSDLGSYDDAALLALLALDEDVLALSGYADSPGELLVMQRRAEAEDVFVVGTGHMLDEFREISGAPEGSPSEYDPGYVAKVRVYFRDDAAIEEFKKLLGVTGSLATAPPSEHGWAFGGWQSYTRIERRTEQQSA